MTDHSPKAPATKTSAAGPRPNDPAQSLFWLRVAAFLSHRSPGTQAAYETILRSWCAFLKVDYGSAAAAQRLVSVNDLHATAYRDHLARRPGQRPRDGLPQAFVQRAQTRRKDLSTNVSAGLRVKKTGLESTLAQATIAKHLTALRRMYRMLIGANLGITHNPFDVDLVPPPGREVAQKRPTEMVSFDVVREIIDSPDPNTPKGLRDRAVLAVMFGGGLRRSEVASLRIGDIKKSPKGTLYLFLRATKAKRDARQGLPPWAEERLLALLKHRLATGASPADYLFVGFTGQAGVLETNRPISGSGIYQLFRHYCALAGANQHCTPHSARATAITKLLTQGLSHRHVQEFSRHASIQMVEVYDKRRISVDESPAHQLDFD